MAEAAQSVVAEPPARSNPGRFVSDARATLGRMWGLERDLTRAELARALKLSPVHGGSHVSKTESGKATLSGMMEVGIELMLDGGVPRHISDIVKPGYPRARR